MKKITAILIILLNICAYTGKANPIEKKFTRSEEFADSLIRTLTLREKVSLLAGMSSTTRSEFGDKDAPCFGITGIPEKNIPDFIMGHGITGVRTGRDINIHSTYFCTPFAIGCSWNVKLYAGIGRAMAKEMRALGQDLNLGPTLNIIRHPLGGRNWECFSEDPYLISHFIVPYVKAMQENGVVCGPKHLAANNQEHERFDINNEIDERTLREIYLPAFKAAVTKGGAMNMMGAYNRLNGEFMCQNSYLLNDILRDEWGFEGFVLSDFSKGLRSTLAGVQGGLNVEMPGPQYYGEDLVQAVENGLVSEQKIDEMLFDVIKTMHWIGCFHRPRKENEEIVHSRNHIQIAKKVAQSSPVLLKNEKSILPISSNIKSVAVIGPNAKPFTTINHDEDSYAYYLQGGGSGRCYYFAESLVSPLDGLHKVLGKKVKINYAQGCLEPNLYANNSTPKNEPDNKKLITQAKKMAENSEVAVVFAGLSGFNESEGWDRTSSLLPGAQNELIQEVAKVNKNIIVVLIAGSYVDVSPWIDKVAGLLFVPYSGEQIGTGIADILTGNISPSGKLPISWPKSELDYPKGSIFKGKGFSVEGISNVYSEGIFVGYRWFDKEQKEVLFPFGYGLSYTAFDYSNLNVKNDTWPMEVSANVKNTGNTEGDEVVQLYISALEPTVEKAPKELKGFAKVALRPGESKTVTFNLHQVDFSHFDVNKKKWMVDSGEYSIGVGTHSRNLMLSGVIEL
ncbi:MAG: beta-glucosidase [Mangrovibacterium sp.]